MLFLKTETLATLIKVCLICFSLPLSQCRGQAYDGASNMSSRISGVAARIQSKEPSAIYVHCLAHCTNLCLQTVGKQTTLIRGALLFVQEVSQLIWFSAKRSSLFEAMQANISPGATALKPLCPTRWTVRTAAIDAALKNYTVLHKALAEINEDGRDEYALKAGGHLNLMEKFSTFFDLHLSHLVFSAIEQLSIQAKDTTLRDAVSASALAIPQPYMQECRTL